MWKNPLSSCTGCLKRAVQPLGQMLALVAYEALPASSNTVTALSALGLVSLWVWQVLHHRCTLGPTLLCPECQLRPEGSDTGEQSLSVSSLAGSVPRTWRDV